jgi:hypothetical protein
MPKTVFCRQMQHGVLVLVGVIFTHAVVLLHHQLMHDEFCQFRVSSMYAIVHFFGFEIGSGRRFFHQFEVLGVAKLTQPIVTGFEIQEQNVRFRQQGKTLLCFSESTFGVLIGVFTDAAFQGHFGGLREGGFDAGGVNGEWGWGFNWLGSNPIAVFQLSRGQVVDEFEVSTKKNKYYITLKDCT